MKKFLPLFPLLACLTFFFGGNTFAAPSDFSGKWKSASGEAVFYADNTDPIKFSACELRSYISGHTLGLDIQDLFVECTGSDGLTFQSSIPAQNLTIGEDGLLYDETGVAGKITGSGFDFQFADAWDGIHYVHMELTDDGMALEWKYVGSVTPSFQVTHGERPLKKVR